jgi:four helix bundle protein
VSVKGLENLEAWRKAKDFALRVYRQALPLLPPEEKWALNQQLRRSAASIPANVAEGHGRFYYQDNVRFCYYARGSLEETLSHIVLAHELGYIPKALYGSLEQDGEGLNRLINGYIGYLKRSKKGASEPGADHAMREAAEPYITDPSSQEPEPTGTNLELANID